MTAPLYERLVAYRAKNRISFAMPGHKNGRGLKRDLLSLDVTELAETENLYNGGLYVSEAQRLLSALYGSEESYILTGGSTAAIQAMICGATRPGDALLAAADCHKSVINTCALLGIKIRFIPKEFNGDFFVPTKTVISSDMIDADTGAVLITSPNYYGVCSDIRYAARICHSRGIPLLVDEAHGAHFAAGGIFPETAVKYADAVCQSAHKTLNALTGAAYMHLNGQLIDRERCKTALTMFQSSSPSYVIAASADTARAELSDGGGWQNVCEMCGDFRASMSDIGIGVMDNDDITRIVLNFSAYELTGPEVAEKLSDKGIDVEMSDLYNIVLIAAPFNIQEDFDTLFDALRGIVRAAKKRARAVNNPPPPFCAQTLDPQPVFYGPRRGVPLDKAAGRISASTVVPYPPGVPAIYIGEKITDTHIRYLEQLIRAGAEINGISDGIIAVKDK